MDICSFDFNLASKFIPLVTPIVAICIFKKWKKQKGSEVIANESKEAIKDLLELSVINLNIVYEGSKSKTELESKLSRFKEVSEKAHRAMLFLNTDQNVVKLGQLLPEYFINKESVYHPIKNVVGCSDEMQIVEFIQLEGTKQNTLRLNKCIDKLITILYPYSIYKKTI
ncbi:MULTISPECIES: hypothetical protein [Acinetobacter]|uniref:hypothetical protein n=1 Tax=Acinetobacter TaxID=469 RepID=UPI0012504FBE|nr:MULTISPECIES: hypothetical protein [Acinetobacter]MDO6643820.1 hypothetical protein [Acinetobacter guillouiae]